MREGKRGMLLRAQARTSLPYEITTAQLSEIHGTYSAQTLDVNLSGATWRSNANARRKLFYLHAHSTPNSKVLCLSAFRV